MRFPRSIIREYKLLKRRPKIYDEFKFVNPITLAKNIFNSKDSFGKKGPWYITWILFFMLSFGNLFQIPFFFLILPAAMFGFAVLLPIFVLADLIYLITAKLDAALVAECIGFFCLNTFIPALFIYLFICFALNIRGRRKRLFNKKRRIEERKKRREQSLFYKENPDKLKDKVMQLYVEKVTKKVNDLLDKDPYS